MSTTVDLHGVALVATVDGRFDAHVVGDFVAHVTEAVSAQHPHVIVDLEAVEFMDSSALAALVRTLKRTMAVGGSITLVAMSDAARIILELTKLDEVFPSAPSVDQALSAIDQAV